ncbi:MAG: hypothetical protein EXR47_07445 [Dehalococcoidia bacterium]|nr:hypothetical protein [Dehalococcoidia bacterium]
MPNLPAHVGLALEWAESLDQPVVRQWLGAYLLGATAPDSRAMTKAAREDTHYMSLDSAGMTAGVDGLFKAHPELQDAARLPEPTVAFLLGYFAHLIADQGWITTVYRPFFGNSAVFSDAAEAKVLDRALQLDEDRRIQQELHRALPLLAEAEAGVGITFMPTATLRDWRAWTQTFLARDFSWERLRFVSRRRQLDEHLDAAERATESFLGAVDESMSRLAQRVPPASVAAYRERAAACFLQVGREFLKCG